MINSLDIRKFVETEKHKNYLNELSGNYKVKITMMNYLLKDVIF